MLDYSTDEIHMRPQLLTPRHFGLMAACGLLAVCLAGCSDEVEPPEPLPAQQAQVAINKALETWKSGDTSDSLQDGDPAIVVSDEDWLAGSKLNSFTVGKSTEQGSSHRYEVELVLVGSDGKQTKSSVAYLVSPGDVISVMREFE